MTDKREFIKLDVGYLSNPKIAALLIAGRPNAVLVHIECMTYSRKHRTDGTVPTVMALRGVIGATKRDVAACVEQGLLRDLGNGTVEVHDFLEHQESAAEIEAKSNAGKIGAAARWGSADRSSDRSAKGNADRMRTAMQRRGEERREEEEASPLPPADAGDAPSKPSRRKPEKPLPDTWEPTDDHRGYAFEHRLNIERETTRFRDHATANDRRARDWDAAFRMWLSKAVEHQPPRPRGGHPGDQLAW